MERKIQIVQGANPAELVKYIETLEEAARCVARFTGDPTPPSFFELAAKKNPSTQSTTTDQP